MLSSARFNTGQIPFPLPVHRLLIWRCFSMPCALLKYYQWKYNVIISFLPLTFYLSLLFNFLNVCNSCSFIFSDSFFLSSICPPPSPLLVHLLCHRRLLSCNCLIPDWHCHHVVMTTMQRGLSVANCCTVAFVLRASCRCKAPLLAPPRRVRVFNPDYFVLTRVLTLTLHFRDEVRAGPKPANINS